MCDGLFWVETHHDLSNCSEHRIQLAIATQEIDVK
jgi:hypothetical protein